MTGNLTWGFKRIQLPKLNSTLLSALSLFVVCLLAFTMIYPAIASHCRPEEEAVENTVATAVLASIALGVAIASGNPFAIAAAGAAWVIACREADAAQDALDKCEAEHNSAGCS